MRIDEIKNAVPTACREFGVRRLDVFGSLARGEGTPSSDVDLLVEFDDPGRNTASALMAWLWLAFSGARFHYGRPDKDEDCDAEDQTNRKCEVPS